MGLVRDKIIDEFSKQSLLQEAISDLLIGVTIAEWRQVYLDRVILATQECMVSIRSIQTSLSRGFGPRQPISDEHPIINNQSGLTKVKQPYRKYQALSDKLQLETIQILSLEIGGVQKLIAIKNATQITVTPLWYTPPGLKDMFSLCQLKQVNSEKQKWFQNKFQSYCQASLYGTSMPPLIKAMSGLECNCIQLLPLNLKMRSRCSSSSSGSLKLIPDTVMETKILLKNTRRDLFDELLEQDFSWQHNQDILRTISELNLSPRSQNHAGCKCTKIDCLKMYCECFSKGRLCNEKCDCNACCNKDGCQLHIYKAQQMANYRHPGTFKGVPAFVPLRRCTCKKSACRKNYCECYRAGMKCTEDCECLDCHNGKPHRHDDYLDSWMEIEVNA